MTLNISAGIYNNIIVTVIFSSSLYLSVYKTGFHGFNLVTFTLILIVFIAIIIQINTSKVVITNNLLLLKGTIWTCLVKRFNITHIEITDTLPEPLKMRRRINGISLFSYRTGKFRLSSGSSAFLLTNKSTKFAILTVKHKKYDKIIFSIEPEHIDSVFSLTWINNPISSLINTSTKDRQQTTL